MNLIKYYPERLSVFDLGRFFNRFFNNFDDGDVRLPAVDVREEDNAYLLEVELPGLTEKDINLKVENGILTISSKKENESEEKRKGYIRKERRYYSFCRSFALPDHVNIDGISATFRNGLLEVNIPKSEAAKPKLIEVKVK
ncbi:MAG: Hsp20/alpha crystallin family protein [Spirochaetota bacterium]